MEKKSVSATILVLFLALTFTVIGVCFSVFVYSETKILVKKVNLYGSSGIKIYESSEKKCEVTELKLSDMELGLKPATGEVDSETQIPSTIVDSGTSEGYYGKVYVGVTGAFKVTLKDISIKSKKDEIEVKKERKNIFVAIKDIDGSTKSLEENEIQLATFESVEGGKELIFFIWLGSLAGEELIGSKISFSLYFDKI